MSGGVSKGQLNTAAGSTADLSKFGTGVQGTQQGVFRGLQRQVVPFDTNLMNNGLPMYRNMTDYSSGDVAQAFAPQRADLMRRTSQYSFLPSGYQTDALNDLRARQARAFDSSLRDAWMANQAAKERGAAGVQGQEQIAGNEGLAYGGQALGANNLLFGGPRKTGFMGALGGSVNQGINALKQA